MNQIKPQKKKNVMTQIAVLENESGHQTVVVKEMESKCINHVFEVKQNNNTLKYDIMQNDPGVGNVSDLNDRADPSKNILNVESVEELRKIVPKKSQTLTCNYFGYTAFRKYFLQRYMSSHSDEHQHKCVVCENDFKTFNSLSIHIKTHAEIKPYQCKICPSNFTSSGLLKRHVRYKHTNEKPHKCTICDYSSVELSKMRSHTDE